MASGKLFNGVIDARRSTPVYTVPSGVTSAFSIIIEGSGSDSFNGAIAYSASGDSFVDFNGVATTPRRLTTNNVYGATAAVVNTVVDAKDIVRIKRDTQVFYLTKDQKKIWSTTQGWVDATSGYTFLIIYNGSSDNLYAIEQKDDTIGDVRVLNQTTFARTGGAWTFTPTETESNHAKGINLVYVIDTSNNLHYLSKGGQHYRVANATPITSDSTSTTAPALFDAPAGSTSSPADNAIAVWGGGTGGAYYAGGTTLYYASGRASTIDNNYSWAGITNSTDFGAVVQVYPEPAADSNDTYFLFSERFLGHTGGTATIYNVSHGVTNPVSLSVGGNDRICIVDSTGTIFAADTTDESTLASFAEVTLASLTYSNFSISNTANVDLISEAFNEIYYKATASVSINFDIAAITDTYDTHLGAFTGISAGTDSISLSTNDYFSLNYSTDISANDYLNVYTSAGTTVSNYTIAESFLGRAVEITGRVLSAGDSVVVYTENPCKVTIMGFES